MTQLEAIKTKEDARSCPTRQKSPLARGAAWSSNSENPPLFLDLPVKDGKQRPVIAREVDGEFADGDAGAVRAQSQKDEGDRL